MNKIGLIIGREFNIRVRKRSFIFITLGMPLLLIAMMVIPALIQIYGGDDSQKNIVVVDQSGVIAENLESKDNTSYIVSDTPYPAAIDKYPGVYGFLVLPENIVDEPRGISFYTSDGSTLSTEMEIEKQLSRIITDLRIADSGVEGLDTLIHKVQASASINTFEIVKDEAGEVSEKSSSSAAAMGVAYITSFMIYMFILLYGMMVLNGVVEEKSNRVMEIMVSSVKPFELMMGKILGIACVAILQFMIWVVLVIAGYVAFSMVIGGDIAASGAAVSEMATKMPSSVSSVFATLGDPWFIIRVLGGFVLYFVGGYLLYASMFAAIGSAVDNAADTQQLQVPVTIPLILALFIMMSAMQNPDSTLVFWCSMIPFTSPIIMMSRLAYGVPVWEFVLSIVLLYGTFVAITYAAARIYRVGIFMYGKKPSLKEVIKWARYKN